MHARLSVSKVCTAIAPTAGVAELSISGAAFALAHSSSSLGADEKDLNFELLRLAFV